MKRIIISMLALLACVNAITAAPRGGGGGGGGRGGGIGGGGMGGGGMGGGGRMGGGMAGGGARMGGGMGGGARGFGGGGMGRMGGGGFAGRSGIGMGARSASFGAGPRMGGGAMGMGRASIGSAQLARPAAMGTMGRSAFSGIQPGAINRPGGITRPVGLGLQPGLSRPGATTLGTQLGTRPGGLRPGQITRPGGGQITGPDGLAKQAGDISRPGIGRPGGLRPGGQITRPDGLAKQAGDISRPGIGRPGQRPDGIGRQPGAQNIRPGDVKRLENVSKTAGLNRQTIGNRQALRKQQNQALRNLSRNPRFAGINKQQFKNQFKHKGWKHWHHGPGGWNPGWWGIGGWWPYGNWNLGWNWAWNNGVWWWGGYPWWWWADYDPVYFSNVVYPVYTTYYQDTPGDQVYNYWDITNNTSDQITVQANSGDSEVIDVGQTERVFHTPGNNQFTVQTQTGFREYNTPNPNVVIQERAGDMASQTRSYESPQYEQMDIPAQRMEIEAY